MHTMPSLPCNVPVRIHMGLYPPIDATGLPFTFAATTASAPERQCHRVGAERVSALNRITIVCMEDVTYVDKTACHGAIAESET